tara:strand:- start:13062 stop:13619 length:558 start_codon:yes stop_codon:yes gene_type:complete
MNREKALFLDRDGIVNVDYGYVHKKEQVSFIKDIFLICKEAFQLKYQIFIITNQAGIARGYYSIQDFKDLTKWIEEEFKSRGIEIKETIFCPYHPEHGIGEFRKDSDFRKPNPGMINYASKKYNIDLKKSILLGDNISDIEAGISAGVIRNFLYNPEISEKEIYNIQNCTKIDSLLDISQYLQYE